MKKRTYRAVPVKKLDWEELAQRLPDRLIVGIDVAKRTMFATLMTLSEEILAVVKWNHLSETRCFARQLADLPATTEVAMEPSGTYGDALRQCLNSSGLEVFRVSPKQVKDSREIFDGVPSSHDAKCSAIVAWLHLLGRSSAWPEPEDKVRAAKAAKQTLTLHAQALMQAKNRLEAHLTRYWPEVLELLELDSAVLLELLACFGGPKGVASAPEEAEELMERVGRGGLKQDKSDEILESADETLGVRMIETEKDMLRELSAEARRRQKAVQTAKKGLRGLSSADPELAQIGAAVGLVTSAVLTSELGSLLAYPNTGSLLKAAGLNLKEVSSGEISSGRRRQGELAITKRGPSMARQYLYLAALRWLHKDRWAQAWYAKKVRRDGGRHKQKAVVALMRKLLRGLWVVARGEAFDSEKLFDTKRLIPAPVRDEQSAVRATRFEMTGAEGDLHPNP